MTTKRTWAASAMWSIALALAAIGIVVALRRILALVAVLGGLGPGASNPDAIEAGFSRYPWLTLTHVVPGLVFMVLGPLQFSRALRTGRPRWHRWCGRIFVFAALVVGVSALVMSPRMAIGGFNETAATMLFAVIFLVALWKGFWHARQRDFAAHRDWMIRAFAVGLAVATIRPIVGVFFALYRARNLLPPSEFFGIAFWIGFTLHLIAAEVWINYTRRPSRAAI